MSSGNPFRGQQPPNGAGGGGAPRPPFQQQAQAQAQANHHTRQNSSTSALSPALRAGGAFIPGSSEQFISHRHSSSADRDRERGNGPYGQQQQDRVNPFLNQSQQYASSPRAGQSQVSLLQHQQPQQYNGAGHVHPGSYQNASIPSSPDLHLNGNGFYSPSGSGSGSGSGGGRGFKHAGVGLMGFGGGRQHDPMDDSASIASLIDRDGNASYDGHGSDSGHTYSTHHDDGFLIPGVPRRVNNYPSISNKHIPTQQHQPLRTKTSYRDFKNSESKIISNEEKYNAYVMPGVSHYDGPEPDDALHDPGPRLKGLGPERRLADSKSIHGTGTFFSWRGWLNVIGLLCIILPLIGFFAAYPIASYVLEVTRQGASMYTNGTGQVPDITGFRGLVDKDTPESVYTKIGQDGLEYTLVFSDEFNAEGRTFYEGDDPYWNAVDMHYYSTSDVEYYDPSRITTHNGNLVINLTRVPDPSQNHGLGYVSGMLTSWNQLCFTGGIVEASVSLPGTNDVTGLWPAFWTMGNLGRASYGSTLEGMWPYSYDSCDTGALPNQTNFKTTKDAITSSEGYPLSYLPGQKLSACTCSGEDHPGPNTKVGRSAPELDVFEALVNPTDLDGEISQTLQLAPFDMDYKWPNTSGSYKMGDKWDSIMNAYRGGIYQQSVSALSHTDQQSYYLVDRSSFQTYSYEYAPSTGTNTDGYVYWLQNGTSNFYLKEEGLAGDPDLDMGQRLIPREPMYMIMNLGMAENFNTIDYDNLIFPAIMRFDWVRIYQRSDAINIGCDPKEFPTAAYIERHIEAYTDWNMTVWVDEEPDGFPKNSLLDGC